VREHGGSATLTTFYVVPRNNGMRRPNKNISTFGEAKTLPEKICGAGGRNPQAFRYLNVNWKSPFHAEPRQDHLLKAKAKSANIED
jgi:hypothetical protein